MSFTLWAWAYEKGPRTSFSGSSSHSVVCGLGLGWWHDASIADIHTHRNKTLCLILYLSIFIEIKNENKNK